MTAPRRILVVDDEPILVRLLARMLGTAGHDVTGARDGREALELATQRTFDLIISDVRMPVMDGPSFLAALRTRDTETPFIFLTGYGDHTDAELRRLGATAVYGKPIAPQELVAAVEAHARAAAT